MINRTLIRTKVVQTLFAYYKNDDQVVTTAEKQLLFSFQRTYDLYHYLLWLPVELRRYAEQKLEAGRQKHRPTEEDLHPNERFVQNQFIRQLEENEELTHYLEEQKLSWVEHSDLIQYLYNKLQNETYYQQYMTAEAAPTGKQDRELVRKLFEQLLPEDDFLQDVLESDSLQWATDVNVVISFILKTLRATPFGLLPMFDDEGDAKMAVKILRAAIDHQAEYQGWVVETLKHWDAERLAYMDQIILQVALAEIMNIATIPVSVSINEYIELAREYSGDQSPRFVNGVLDAVVKAHAPRKAFVG